MTEDHIRYDQLIDEAMRSVVREALLKVKDEGLNGEHHFLISFFTNYENVDIPAKLKEKYPEEMTIVLQHQYEDLEIKPDFFQVVLSFEGKKERIKIPFNALTSFADPGVRFGLKFNILADENMLDELVDDLDDEIITKKISDIAKKEVKKTEKKKATKVKTSKAKNVVDLSSFRDKKK